MILKTIATLLLLISFTFSYSQIITPFSIRQQVTQKGGIRYLSNTAVSCSGIGCGIAQNEAPPAGTGYDNSFNAGYTDIDGNVATFMSSSDSLALPDCSQITWAGLYWGGEMTNAGSNYATRNKCKVKVNNGSYVNVTAAALQDNTIGFDTYHCFADITGIVLAAGIKARFTVADVAVRVGGTNRFGGWTIVVIYKNDLQPMRNLTVFNGLSNVSTGNLNTDITISGFLTPLSGPVTFEIGAVTYDGDRGLAGDQLQFKGGSSFVNISDAANSVSDIFNSTLSYNGAAKTTPFINPAYKNTLGYDADIFLPNNAVKNYIGNSATSATLRLTTANPGGETYLTQVVTMAIDVYEPDLRAGVRVIDVNGGLVEPGDILEYTVVGKNIGSDPSVNTFIIDTLERNAIYVPGSLTIINGPNTGAKTDALSDDQAEYIAASKTVRVRVGTGANAVTGGQMNNSPAGVDSTVFKYRVTTTADCFILSCDNVIDNRAYITGTGNVSGNTFSNGSNPDIFDINGCPIPGTTSTPINAVTCAPPAASSGAPACTGGTINLFATASPAAAYSWTGPNSFTAIIANPVITNVTSANAGTYTVVISIPGSSCAFSPTTNVTVGIPTQTGQLAGSPGGGVATQVHDVAIAAGSYTDNNCNMISKVVAFGASPVAGTIASKVWVENAVPMNSGAPFVPRHYEISPATNPNTATGTVTLYFLQSEFTAFNSAPGSMLNLPTAPGDAAGIANLYIGFYAGISSDGSGLPSSYTGARSVINPADASIIWNATALRWEISVPVTGFGAFIVQTNLFTLPVTLVSFTAEKLEENVLLKWQTASEINSSHFIVEHSTDSRQYNTIGTVVAAGNSNTLLHYVFMHTLPKNGNNFYRLQQVDIDGRVTYTPIARVAFDGKGTGFFIVINPVKEGKLQVQFDKDAAIMICNIKGQVIYKQRVTAGLLTIDIGKLSKGIYVLRAGNETRKFIVE